MTEQSAEDLNKGASRRRKPWWALVLLWIGSLLAAGKVQASNSSCNMGCCAHLIMGRPAYCDEIDRRARVEGYQLADRTDGGVPGDAGRTDGSTNGDGGSVVR